eukprot:TRINITY_DN80_c0_g1_i2.p1 TRINITY_DN80_c0_g1~~TRINITY_DN80_c0_g1_i2.p1  ORF type:complete len:261 (-),score=42.12 TRINITY_DN80_c0_g1_i2:90-872(-)
MKTVFVFFVLLGALCAYASAANTNCAGCVDGKCFDLKKLKDVVGGEMSCRDPALNTYFYQVCGVSSQNCRTAADQTPAICQRDTRMPPEYHDCGNANKFNWKRRTTNDGKEGFLLEFTGGSEDRKIDIDFVCDKSATGVGTFEAADPSENPVKDYHLKWTTEHACPTGKSGDGGGDGGDGDDDDGMPISGGWIFIIILVGLFFLYFLFGAIFMAWRKQARGLDIIPNKDFWFALPGLFIAGHVFLWQKARGLCGAKYESV